MYGLRNELCFKIYIQLTIDEAITKALMSIAGIN